MTFILTQVRVESSKMMQGQANEQLIQCKPCCVFLEDLRYEFPSCNMETFRVNVFKDKLKQWKEKKTASDSSDVTERQDTSGSSDRADSSDLEESTDDLKPIPLIAIKHGIVPKSSGDVNLDSLVQSFQTRRAAKVDIKVDDDIRLAVKKAVTAENEQLESILRLEQEHGQGKIEIFTPGIHWLNPSPTDVYLSALPDLGSSTPECVGKTDHSILNLVKCPSKCSQLGLNFALVSRIVIHKTLLLDNMFLAMCLHTRQCAIESAQNCLESLLSHNYKGVCDVFTSWVPQCKHIMTAIKYFGGASVDYTEHIGDKKSHSSISPTSHPAVNNIKAFLSVITITCKYRYKYDTDDALEIIAVIVKLSLDQSLISTELSMYFKDAICSLIPSMLSSYANSSQSPPQTGEQELTVCRRLISIVQHHRNLLHMVNLISPQTDRVVDFRQTLAYLTLTHIISGREAELTSSEWSMVSLAEAYFNVEVNEAADMYRLHTLMQLFDAAVGYQIQPEEKEYLDDMRHELRKQCKALRENPMLPDISKTKSLMHRVSLRWEWLVRQATSIDDLLGITHKPTPTKIIPVDSQEVRPPGCDEDDDMMDSVGTTSAEGLDEGVSQAMATNTYSLGKAEAIKQRLDISGLEKLRVMAKEFVKTGSISPKANRSSPSTQHSSSLHVQVPGTSGVKAPHSTPITSPKDLASRGCDVMHGKAAIQASLGKKLSFESNQQSVEAPSEMDSTEQGDETESMEVDDIPDLD